MKQVLLIMIATALFLTCGCIQASYKNNPMEYTEFKFAMWNESDIGDLEITAPGGWHVKATRMSNKTAIDQGIIAESVIRAVTGIP